MNEGPQKAKSEREKCLPEPPLSESLMDRFGPVSRHWLSDQIGDYFTDFMLVPSLALPANACSMRTSK
jgi:hypothetical protein